MAPNLVWFIPTFLFIVFCLRIMGFVYVSADLVIAEAESEALNSASLPFIRARHV